MVPWKRFFLYTLFLAALLPLVSYSDRTSDDQRKKNRARLKEMQKTDPQEYSRLCEAAKEFVRLSEEEKDRLRRLNEEIEELPVSRQRRLFRVMHRYESWLENLPEEERQKILLAPDKRARLKLISNLRQQQWIQTLPKAYRRQISQLAGPEQDQLIQQIRREQKLWNAKWQLAFNHWIDLVNPNRRRTLETRIEDFPKELQAYINEYLRLVMSKQEWNQLKAAEGQWPKFPCLLVQIADRYPTALPGPRGPTTLAQLPRAVRERLIRSKSLNRRLLLRAQGKWPAFGKAVAEMANKGQLGLPYELWPTRIEDLSKGCREFLRNQLMPVLSEKEIQQLERAEGYWPEFPLTIQRLAKVRSLTVPWATLPGPSRKWEAYRVEGGIHVEPW